MEVFTLRDLTFTYPGASESALNGITFSVDAGEMITVCGRSGSGKSTLLRNLKPVIAPYGEISGETSFCGTPLTKLSHEEQTARIGYVMQNPDNQVVTDKVWRELAFGLESLGEETETIRLRVAEMASYFGIQTWFHRDVSELSGGQKQLLNLASVMVMQPDVLILDEPTAQLDPIASDEFIGTVKKINRELGTTVIMTEHRLEPVIPISDRVIVLEGGQLIADDIPANVGAILSAAGNSMFMAMPAPLQTYAKLYNRGIGRELECPVDVRGGRTWLSDLMAKTEITAAALPEEESVRSAETAVEIKNAWFRYSRDGEDVIRDLSVAVHKGELFCIVGGNGAGKTTAINIMGGLKKPYRGRTRAFGRTGTLPQNPQTMFVEKTLMRDLMEVFDGHSLLRDEKERRAEETAEVLELDGLLDMHPYDLSGGEQQRAALAKVLLTEPEILIMDEPTKGLDPGFKEKLAAILKKLQSRGITIIMASHDIEFCCRHADRCAMMFDGRVTACDAPRRFFAGNSFYTTAANRMSRHVFANAVTADDIVKLVEKNLSAAGTAVHGGGKGEGGELPEDEGGGKEVWNAECMSPEHAASENTEQPDGYGGIQMMGRGRQEPRPAPKKVHAEQREPQPGQEKVRAGLSRPRTVRQEDHSVWQRERPARRSAVLFAVDITMIALALATVLAGIYLFDNQKYFIVSMMLVIYAMVPFFARFEHRSPKAREIVLLAVMITAGVAGRAAFFMLPNFKPLVAVIIISGAALGRQAGFLVGAMSAFVSNFLFGQGPWTTWQMLAMALIGYLAGAVFHRYGDRIKVIPLAIFGGLATFFIYGAITDMWTILMMTSEPSLKAALIVYGAAVPFNAVHAAATIFFLLLLARPMVDKLSRVKIKYGMRPYS